MLSFVLHLLLQHYHTLHRSVRFKVPGAFVVVIIHILKILSASIYGQTLCYSRRFQCLLGPRASWSLHYQVTLLRYNTGKGIHTFTTLGHKKKKTIYKKKRPKSASFFHNIPIQQGTSFASSYFCSFRRLEKSIVLPIYLTKLVFRRTMGPNIQIFLILLGQDKNR